MRNLAQYGRQAARDQFGVADGELADPEQGVLPRAGLMRREQDADEVAGLVADLSEAGETVHVIGAIEAGERGCTVSGTAEDWSARQPWEAVHLA